MSAERTSIVVGTVGTVRNLFEVVEARLRETQTGWDDLARRAGVSRQYVTRVLREPKMPLDFVVSVCRAVGLRPASVIEPTTFVRSLADVDDDAGGSSAPPAGGSCDDETAADLREAEEALEQTRAQLRARNSKIQRLERQLAEARGQLDASDRSRPSQSAQSQHFTF